MEVPKSPHIVKRRDWRGILQYGDFIDVWSEGKIFIDNDNRPTPESITVPESGE